MTAAEYNKCIDEHSDNVYRFILKNIKDKERARDIVQDAFEKCWLKVTEIDATRAKSYLFTTAYRTMIDDIRKEKLTSDLDSVPESSHSTYSPYLGLKDIVNDALGKLSEIQRSVITLRDYEGYSYDEIGEITGLNEAQVKVYIYRARVFMKQYIGSLDRVL